VFFAGSGIRDFNVCFMLLMKRAHFATPSETAFEVFTRFSSPPVDFGVPVLAGRVRSGDVVEVAGTAQWLVSEVFAYMVASVVSSLDGQVVLLDVQQAHDFGRMVFLARERMRGHTEEEMRNKLERLRVVRCDSALHLLCALRQCEELAEASAASQRPMVIFVDGLANLFWPNKQMGKGSKKKKKENEKFSVYKYYVTVSRGVDLLAGCVKLMRQLAVKQNATIVASKLVFFPRKGLFEDYFGNGWKSTCKVMLGVEDVKMTTSALGKTGPRAIGYWSDAEQPDRKNMFVVSMLGCQFGT
jgi:hypothetical protein